VKNPGVSGVVRQLDDDPTALAEYWHTIRTEHADRREPGCNLELIPKPIGTEKEQAQDAVVPHVVRPGMTLIADSRLAELRKVVSPEFDFKKLIRLCEEINTVYSEGCYFATAMLTRGVLDHVPPLFGKKTFGEVANNYSDGGKSFKESMHHLENAARKVADAHLHMPIRKGETLPVAQQVNFASQLDVLLSEIIRISQ
jgi:hypothetical protein